MTVVAMVNQKGGVGKTTVTLGLAAAAASSGRRVLVIDLDPQANATSGLGVWNPVNTIDDVLASDATVGLSAAIVRAGWPPIGGQIPRVVPSAAALAQREPQLATDPIGAQDRLSAALEDLARDEPDAVGAHPGDLVLIDCPPSLSLLTVNGLFAADLALVVTEPAAWARDGVEQVLRTIRRVSQRRGGALRVGGLVVNRLGRTRDATYWSDQLHSDYADMVLPSIQLRAAVAEASAQSVPLHALGTRSGAVEAMEQFEKLYEAIAHVESTNEENTHGLRPATVAVPPSRP